MTEEVAQFSLLRAQDLPSKSNGMLPIFIGGNSFRYNGRTYGVRLYHENLDLNPNQSLETWQEIAKKTVLSVAARGLLPGTEGNIGIAKVDVNYTHETITQKRDCLDGQEANDVDQKVANTVINYKKTHEDDEIENSLSEYQRIYNQKDRELVPQEELSSKDESNPLGKKPPPAAIDDDELKAPSILQTGVCPPIDTPEVRGRGAAKTDKQSRSRMQKMKASLSSVASSVANIFKKTKAREELSPKEAFEKAEAKKKSSSNPDRAYLKALKAMYERQKGTPWDKSWNEVDYEELVSWGDRSEATMEFVTGQLRADISRLLIDFNGNHLLTSDVPEERGLELPEVEDFSPEDKIRFIQQLSQTGAAILALELDDRLIPESSKGGLLSEFYGISIKEDWDCLFVESFVLELDSQEDTRDQIQPFLEKLIFYVEHGAEEPSLGTEIASARGKELLNNFKKLSKNDKKLMIYFLNKRLSNRDNISSCLSTYVDGYKDSLEIPAYPFSLYTDAIVSSGEGSEEEERKIMVHKVCKFDLKKYRAAGEYSDSLATIVVESVIDFDKKKAWKRYKILEINREKVK